MMLNKFFSLLNTQLHVHPKGINLFLEWVTSLDGFLFIF